MTWRTIWTPPGHFAPRWHDFRYEQAARHLEGIVSELGASAEVVELNEGSDTDSEPATGDLRASAGSGRVVGPTEGKA